MHNKGENISSSSVTNRQKDRGKQILIIRTSVNFQNVLWLRITFERLKCLVLPNLVPITADRGSSLDSLLDMHLFLLLFLITITCAMLLKKYCTLGKSQPPECYYAGGSGLMEKDYQNALVAILIQFCYHKFQHAFAVEFDDDDDDDDECVLRPLACDR